MIPSMKKILLCLPILFLLAGCVSLHAPTVSTAFGYQTPKTRQASLSKLTNWSLDGALSITTPGQQPEIANYTWHAQDKDYTIRLSSSLSLYQIVIQKTGSHLTLTKNGTPVAAASTAEGLMMRALGWSLPVSLLQYWIKGIPAPHVAFQATYDRFGHLALLNQAGFLIHYQRYQTIQPGLDTPQLISMQNPHIFAKIVIKHFQVRS